MPETTRTLAEVIQLALQSWQANIHTATIARVERVRTKTIDVKPVVNRVVNGESIEMPTFADVPPLFLGGGASYMSFPVAFGDYALLIFTERCFDLWYSGQDFKAPIDRRMHDYSDAIALVGLKVADGMATIPVQNTILGVTRIGLANPSGFAALSSKVDTEIQRIWDVLTTWTVVPADGGAALKTAAAAAVLAKQPTASEFVKCE